MKMNNINAVILNLIGFGLGALICLFIIGFELKIVIISIMNILIGYLYAVWKFKVLKK